MIKMLVIGRVGKDCTVNEVNGKSVINFSVAHSEKYKDSNGVQNEKTTWVDCAYWTDRTAVAPYIIKGAQVYVEGFPEVKMFTRQDRSAGASLAVRVLTIQLLGSKQDQDRPAQGGAPIETIVQPDAASITEPIDDLPF